MKISDAQDYPVENMSLIYSGDTNDVYQAVFQTEKFGTFTRVDGQWLALSPEDTSLENLSIIDILPEDYKVVTEKFDAAQKANRYLRYDEVKEYEVVYSFDGSADAMKDDEEDEEIPDLTDADIEQLRKEALARKKASEKIPFTDVPPSLQELIRDMIGRIENKFDEEETDLMTADLKGFIAGRYNYTPSEMSSQMAKLLRALT
jgi:hypothetical protein